jgi:hypothetical protein
MSAEATRIRHFFNLFQTMRTGADEPKPNARPFTCLDDG